jgi:glycogen synthase
MPEPRTETPAHSHSPRATRKRRHVGKGRGKPRVRKETVPGARGEPLDDFAGGAGVPRAPPRNGGIVRPVTPGRPLHIVMVGWEWPPNHSGGLGVHCFEISKEITRLGHRITFLTPFTGPFTPVDGVVFRFPGGPPAPTQTSSPAIDYPPAYWSGGTPESPFMDATDGYNVWIGLLDGLGPVDVVHVHDWFGTVGAKALAERLRVPLVQSIHSTEYDRSLGHPWEHILQREQIGIDAAVRVIAVSRHLRQQIIDRYHADPAKMRVIYNAVRPSDRLERIDPAKRVVLYVGRLAVMKGVDT